MRRAVVLAALLATSAWCRVYAAPGKAGDVADSMVLVKGGKEHRIQYETKSGLTVNCPRRRNDHE